MKGFGPGLSETDAISFGKYVTGLKDTSSRKARRKMGRKDSRKVLL
jgi:hypothetical protein